MVLIKCDGYIRIFQVRLVQGAYNQGTMSWRPPFPGVWTYPPDISGEMVLHIRPSGYNSDISANNWFEGLKNHVGDGPAGVVLRVGGAIATFTNLDNPAESFYNGDISYVKGPFGPSSNPSPPPARLRQYALYDYDRPNRYFRYNDI